MEFVDVLDEHGNLTGEKKERNSVHITGEWHKIVQIFVVNEDNILLQQRSLLKKSDPGKWCASASGHISAGEISLEAAIKEFKEELGIVLNKNDLKLIDTFKSPSVVFSNGNKIINNHFVDLYIVNKKINISDIVIQKEEVANVKFFTRTQFLDLLNNSPEDLINAPILFKRLIDNLN